jgi:CBS domain containing-hemolysin-like protein
MYTTLIVFALIAVVVSFLCSLWESVLLSISPSYALVEVEKGTAIGKQIQSFKENIDRPLAAILTLNTVAHTVGAIGVGEQATRLWAESNPMITGLLVPIVMTLAILILSEIIPKTLGANYWKVLTPFTTMCLVFLLKLLAPLIWMTQLITGALSNDKSSSVLSRTEFMVMADVGAKEGVFEEGETEIIKNLLRFRTVKIRDIMTPRVVTTIAPASMTVAEFHQQLADVRFSRIPIHSDNHPEDLVGYVRKDEILRHVADGKGDQKIDTFVHEIPTVQEDLPITGLFNKLIEKREHIAVVAGEFGGLSGIVTLEDVIETMLGLEIVDESDEHEDMQTLAREVWKVRAEEKGLFETTRDKTNSVDDAENSK